ncbi:methyltransferase domain-containing protein [Candidatus Pelagibacter sp.]|nr:methyltransferase domain-containing protein [Candidatus Pelagibacter sp.]|tara:strand:- start:1401 stop:2057 length:657 start_codon:yes stop_codon:yes gene_type:complete
MNTQFNKKVSKFFDGYSSDFDEIYDDELDKKNPAKYYLSRLFRSSMFTRFSLTIELLKDKKYKHILDMGCGAGRYSHALARFDKEITGIDFANEMIILANKISKKNKISNVNFECISAEEYKFSKSFDAVICLGFFDYIENPLNLIKKILDSGSKKFIGSFPKKNHILTFQRKIRYKLRNCPLYFYEIKDLNNFKNSLKINELKITDLGRDFLVEIDQ